MVAENLTRLLERANKILQELEAFEASKYVGPVFEATRKSLIEKLSEASDNILSSATSMTSPSMLSSSKPLKNSRNQSLYLKDQDYMSSPVLKEEKRLRNVIEKRTLRDIKKKLSAEIKHPSRERDQEGRGDIEIRKPNFYVRFANFLFKSYSNRLIKRGHLKDLAFNIRKSGLNILVNSYVSVIFLNTLLAFFAGILIGLFLTFFSLKIVFAPIPIEINLLAFSAFTLARNMVIWPLLASSFIFLFSYYYPSLEVSSRRSKINDELPFALIHMSAIAGSGVEPTKIFRIISDTAEYKEFGKETRKVINKINLYGHDLSTALKESARLSPSDKVRELFNGMATVITTGGDLKLYLEKKSADTMTEYKLSRRRFAEAAGTYADVYTGVLIAAPLIFGVILAVMAPLGGKVLGLSFQSVSVLGLVGIFILNVVFLAFMKLVQPSD